MLARAKRSSRWTSTLALFWATVACATVPARHPEPEPLPHDVVARAARPFYGIAGGQRLNEGSLNALLKSRAAVCVGETHDNPIHHYVQLQVLDLLSGHSASVGESFATGFEMFQSPFQSVLDLYRSQKLSEAELLKRTEYKKRWAFDFSLYRPLLERARAQGARLLALNAPREWTKAVARSGLTGISPTLKNRLPALLLTDGAHREFFATAMSRHPSGSADQPPPPAGGETAKPNTEIAHAPAAFDPSLERYYQAQVLWDEQMADVAARWVSAQPKASRIIILAGAGHCHRSAIPRRFERRTKTPMLSVSPIAEENLGLNRAPKDDAFDLLLVFRGSDAAAQSTPARPRTPSLTTPGRPMQESAAPVHPPTEPHPSPAPPEASHPPHQ